MMKDNKDYRWDPVKVSTLLVELSQVVLYIHVGGVDTLKKMESANLLLWT